MEPGLVVQPAVPVGLGPVLEHTVQPVLGETPLMRKTLDSATSRAWATLGADQPSSVLSRMRARAGTRAGLLPVRTRCSSWSRSSPVSRTGNFSLTIPPPHSNTISAAQNNIPEKTLNHPLNQV